MPRRMMPMTKNLTITSYDIHGIVNK